MDNERSYRIIAVDFDNTLFETDYPIILRPIFYVINSAKTRREKRGDKFILWTCREGSDLEEAVAACKSQGLEFDAVNDNLPELKEKWGNNSRKIFADEYWDDKNISIVHSSCGWTSPHDSLESFAVETMPLWATLWALENGGILDANLVFEYVAVRLRYFDVADLEWFKRRIEDILKDGLNWKHAKDEEAMLIDYAKEFCSKIQEEIERRKPK